MCQNCREMAGRDGPVWLMEPGLSWSRRRTYLSQRGLCAVSSPSCYQLGDLYLQHLSYIRIISLYLKAKTSYLVVTEPKILACAIDSTNQGLR